MYNVLAIILGCLFGAVLYYTGASVPRKISSMLRLEDLSLMKIILFAIGLSSVLVAIFSLLGLMNINHFNIKSTNLGVLIGGLLFGIGFGSIGSCPGTCVAASSGGGYKKALSTIIGGLLGAFTFSIFYETFKNLGLFSTMNLGKITLFEISNKYDFLLPLGYYGLIVVGIILMVLATIIPNRS